jgi:hypothetical protein
MESAAKRAAMYTAALCYLFLAPHLWYFGLIYSWDTVWFAGQVTFVALYISNCASPRLWKRLCFCAAAFLGAYTNQFMLASVVSLFLFNLLWEPAPGARRLCSQALAAASAALALTLFQYSSVDGLKALLAASQQQVTHRRVEGELGAYQALLHNFLVGAPHLVTVLLLCGAAGVFMRRGRWLSNERLWGAAFSTLLAPGFVTALLLPEWAAMHRFSLLPFTIAASLLMAHVVAVLWTGGEGPRLPKRALVVCALLLICVTNYQAFIELYPVSRLPRASIEIGTRIRGESEPDIPDFAVTEVSLFAPVMTYAGRNVLTVGDRPQAERWLEEHSLRRGRLFVIDHQGLVVSSSDVYSAAHEN